MRRDVLQTCVFVVDEDNGVRRRVWHLQSERERSINLRHVYTKQAALSRTSKRASLCALGIASEVLQRTKYLRLNFLLPLPSFRSQPTPQAICQMRHPDASDDVIQMRQMMSSLGAPVAVGVRRVRTCPQRRRRQGHSWRRRHALPAKVII